MKTNIEILQSYGGKYQFHKDNLENYSGFKCIWVGGGWHREGYGETEELAARIVLEGLHYIVHHKVRKIEEEHKR